MFKIGIDVGGTFTDFVVVRTHETPRYFKTHSTPAIRRRACSPACGKSLRRTIARLRSC